MRSEPQPSPRGTAPPSLGMLSRELVLSLYVPAIALSLGQGIAAPVLPIYAKSFDVTFGVASLVIILNSVGSFVATVPTGYLIDRIGRRPVLLAGPLLTALTAFLTAFAQSFPELLVYRFLGGCASQMWQLSRLAMITDSGAARERGRLITWMTVTQGVGQLIAPAIGGLVAAVWGIRVPFVLLGALTLVAIIPSFFITKETDPMRVQTGARGKQTGDWAYVFGELVRPQMLTFLVAQFLANASRGIIIGGLMNLYAAYAYGVGPATLGWVATANSAIGLPIGFSTGYIMDRWGRKKTIVPGFGLIFISMLFLTLVALQQWPFPVFVAGFLFMSSSQSITGGNMQVMGSDLAPVRARGRFFSVWRLIGQGGSAASPVLFAVVAEAVSYAASFAVAGLCALAVAVIVAQLIPETVGYVREIVDTSKGGPPSSSPPRQEGIS